MDFLNYLRNPFILNKLLIATTLENPLGTNLLVRVSFVREQTSHLNKNLFYICNARGTNGLAIVPIVPLAAPPPYPSKRF